MGRRPSLPERFTPQIPSSLCVGLKKLTKASLFEGGCVIMIKFHLPYLFLHFQFAYDIR